MSGLGKPPQRDRGALLAALALLPFALVGIHLLVKPPVRSIVYVANDSTDPLFVDSSAGRETVPPGGSARLELRMRRKEVQAIEVTSSHAPSRHCQVHEGVYVVDGAEAGTVQFERLTYMPRESPFRAALASDHREPVGGGCVQLAGDLERTVVYGFDESPPDSIEVPKTHGLGTDLQASFRFKLWRHQPRGLE